MVTVKIKKLIGELNIHTTNMDEATETIKNKVSEALVSVVKDFEMCNNSIKEEPVVQTTENTFKIITNIIKHTSLSNERKADLIERAIINYQSLKRTEDRKIISSFLSPLQVP